MKGCSHKAIVLTCNGLRAEAHTKAQEHEEIKHSQSKKQNSSLSKKFCKQNDLLLQAWNDFHLPLCLSTIARSNHCCTRGTM